MGKRIVLKRQLLPQSKLATIIMVATFTTLSCLTIKKPAWTEKTPVNQGYYIGIGSAAKTPGGTDHIAQARDIALEQIAASISVHITSQTTSQQLEQSGIRLETFQSKITSMVKTDLVGYEFVESWENNTEYWVYYRLSKELYQMLVEQRKMASVMLATQYQSLGKKAVLDEDIASAISYYFYAAKEIWPHRGFMSSLASQSPLALDAQIISELRQILSSIIIRKQELTEINDPTANPNIKAAIGVFFPTSTGEKIPVKNIPLEMVVTSGFSRFSPLVPTNASGISFITASNNRTPIGSEIKVRPSLMALAGFENETPAGPEIIDFFQNPYSVIRIQSVPQRVAVIAREENLGGRRENSVVAGKLKEFLSVNNWRVLNDAAQADYLLYISVGTVQGIVREGIHTAFASGDVWMVDNSTQEEILRTNLQRISGAGLGFEDAGMDALAKFAGHAISSLGL